MKAYRSLNARVVLLDEDEERRPSCWRITSADDVPLPRTVALRLISTAADLEALEADTLHEILAESRADLRRVRCVGMVWDLLLGLGSDTARDTLLSLDESLSHMHSNDPVLCSLLVAPLAHQDHVKPIVELARKLDCRCAVSLFRDVLYFQEQLRRFTQAWLSLDIAVLDGLVSSREDTWQTLVDSGVVLNALRLENPQGVASHLFSEFRTFFEDDSRAHTASVSIAEHYFGARVREEASREDRPQQTGIRTSRRIDMNLPPPQLASAGLSRRHLRALANVGFPVRLLATLDGLPTWLLVAVGGLARIAESQPHLTRATLSDAEIHCPTIKYSPARKIWSALASKLKKKMPQGCRLLPYEDDSLHAPNTPEYLRSCKVLFPYPYFLTSHKMHTCGVLPFGLQESIGIAVPTHNTEWYDELAALKAEMEEKTPNTDQLIHRSRAFVATLVDDIAEFKGKTRRIAFTDGYATEEIVFEIVSLLSRQDYGAGPADPSLLGKYLPLRETIDPRTTDEQRDHQPPPAIPTLLKCTSQYEAFFFDPATAPDPTEFASRDFEAYVLMHGLEIPVGLGFSLPFVQHLLQPIYRNRVEKLLKEALAAVRKRFKSQLQGIQWLEVDDRRVDQAFSQMRASRDAPV